VTAPSFLPVFDLSTVSPETGRQDKVEISLGTWSIPVTHEEDDVFFILTRLGAPPPVNRNTRTREEHGEGYGWIFNTVNPNFPKKRYLVDIRKEPLSIEGRTERVAPPLFSGKCDWSVRQNEGDYPFVLTGKLRLSVNPTKFLRHRAVAIPLPRGVQEHLSLPAPCDGEVCLDNNDNWFPLSRELQKHITPEKWSGQVSRFLEGIESAFQSELERVCAHDCTPIVRNPEYSIGRVETYWEWLSPDPSLMVRSLEPYLMTFSQRFRGKRTYEATESFQEGDMAFLRIQTAPGEWLKIYAKTNRRIRIEIQHELRGDNRFQFPRERNRDGTTSRSSRHQFTTREKALQFLERLRRRAAELVNSFLKHVSRQATLVPSHISGYTALLHILDAIPKDYPGTVSLVSLLINFGAVSAYRNAPEHYRQVIESLRAKGILELVPKRRAYLVTEPYRYALEMLRKHSSFSLLTSCLRERSRKPKTETCQPTGGDFPRCRERRRNPTQ